jgi:hypothetical protein
LVMTMYLQKVWFKNWTCRCKMVEYMNSNMVPLDNGMKVLEIKSISDLSKLCVQQGKHKCSDCYKAFTQWCFNLVNGKRYGSMYSQTPDFKKSSVEIELSKLYPNKIFISTDIDCDLGGSWTCDKNTYQNGKEIRFQRVYLNDCNDWTNPEIWNKNNEKYQHPYNLDIDPNEDKNEDEDEDEDEDKE